VLARLDNVARFIVNAKESAVLSDAAAARAGRLRQRYGLIVKGKRISCPPPQHLLIRVALPVQEYDYEHGFPLIRSLRASTQRSTSVLFSFVLSLLIVAGSFAIRQLKTILRRSLFPIKFQVHQSRLELGLCFSD
jgi:hypothetical protein